MLNKKIYFILIIASGWCANVAAGSPPGTVPTLVELCLKSFTRKGITTALKKVAKTNNAVELLLKNWLHKKPIQDTLSKCRITNWLEKFIESIRISSSVVVITEENRLAISGKRNVHTISLARYDGNASFLSNVVAASFNDDSTITLLKFGKIQSKNNAEEILVGSNCQIGVSSPFDYQNRVCDEIKLIPIQLSTTETVLDKTLSKERFLITLVKSFQFSSIFVVFEKQAPVKNDDLQGTLSFYKHDPLMQYTHENPLSPFYTCSADFYEHPVISVEAFSLVTMHINKKFNGGILTLQKESQKELCEVRFRFQPPLKP